MRFVDHETGAPLVGQRCSVRAAAATMSISMYVDSAEGRLGLSPRSGADGIVRFRVRPGLFVVDPDAREVDEQQVDDVAAGETREVSFAIRTRCDAAAYVRVIDAESWRPLSEVELALENVPAELKDATRHTRTDADGLAVLRIPTWIGAQGSVDPPGYGPVQFLLGPSHGSPDSALVLR